MSTVSSELYLFSAVARALSHSIRGDLSVITNDLAYFGTALPSEDVERSKGRCARITATLSKLSLLREPSLERESVSVSDLAQVLGVTVLGDRPLGVAVSIDRGRFFAACALIRDLLDTTGASRVDLACSGTEDVSLEFSTGRVTQVISASKCITQWASEKLGEGFVIDAAVADLILRAHGCGVECVACETGTRIRVSFERKVER